jgi:hypothetical protein
MKTKLILTALSLAQACILIAPGNATAQSPAPSSAKKPNILVIFTKWGAGAAEMRAAIRSGSVEEGTK